ncbi:MAG TPA: alpha/beta fold hydrolase [Ktedonobacteraceae bacterium]|nr:alpha/beta fold hydrolase [Ktedonobacteraceae bacterium]
MALDIELYRRTIYTSVDHHTQKLRRISVIDIHPEGATRTLVLAHGYGGSATQWLYQLQFFGQTMRVIAPDMRGHGMSDDPENLPYTMKGLVDDLVLVLDRLEVQHPFYLLAHSFGGAISTEFALRHPEEVSGLVLIGVPTRFILRAIVERLMLIPDPLFSWIAKVIKVALFAPQRTLKRMLHSVLTPWRGDERVQLLQVPTLVVLGHRDTVFLREHYEDVPRNIPHAQQVVIPVSSHLVQLERPDAVNRAIRRFIEPRATEGKSESRTRVTQLSPHAARHAEMPWLQYYDREVPESLPIPKQSLHDLLSNASREFPDRAALIFFGQKIGYRELDRLSNRFAHALQRLGVKKGDRVAIVLPNIPQFVIAFYGILKAGAVVVLGSPLSNEAEIAYQLQHSSAQVLLTLSSYHAMVERVYNTTHIKQVIYSNVREYLPIRQRVKLASLIDESGNAIHVSTSQSSNHVSYSSLTSEKREQRAVSAANSQLIELIDQNNFRTRTSAKTASLTQEHLPLSKPTWKQYDFQQLLRSQPMTPLNSGTGEHDLALLQYTSGTTDIPKGVMLSHGNLVVNIVQVRHWMPDARRGREVVLCALPLSHSYGVTSCMNTSIGIAGTLVLLPTSRINRILEAIKNYHPTIFPGIPALYLAIANYPKVRSYGVAAIRTCISGSAPLPVEVQEEFEKLTRGRLVEGYGLTEASPVTHSNPLKGERHVGSIGIPLPETNACIVDLKTGENLPYGEIGELLISGPQVMQGYWNMPEESQNTLKNGWLHTGDLARMDEDGFFTIVDRKKDLILAGSYNVYPRDVEEVLYEHPKVLEVVVVSIRDSNEINRAGEESTSPASPFIKAFVVLKRGEKATPDELLALCRERLDAYKVPRQIEFRSELPKNFVGKVLRRLLVET